MQMLGRIASPPDERDHPLRLYASLDNLVLPARYGTHSRWPVYNQGNTPQCVAYSASLMRHVSERLSDKQNLTFDAPELYARCKEVDGIPNEDGTIMRTAADILLHRGEKVIAANQATDVGTFKRISAYARLRTIEEIKAAIFLMGSAWIGSTWYEEWFDLPNSNVFPAGHSVAGGHAYTFIGYSDAKKAFRVQNSWGTTWGKKGKAWLPYDFVRLDDEANWEAWRLIDLKGD